MRAIGPYRLFASRAIPNLWRGAWQDLNFFSSQHPVLGIAEISDELGMSRSTTHRYFITLVALDFMKQIANRKYLGLRVIDLGMSALNSTGLREHAYPNLDELRKRTTFTTSLALFAELDHVTEEGIAIDDEECAPTSESSSFHQSHLLTRTNCLPIAIIPNFSS